MFGFILRFIHSTIKSQKARMSIVLCGMIICSFFVLSFFYFCSAGSKSKEEFIDMYFCAEYRYMDSENIEEIIEVLNEEKKISKIQLYTWLDGDLDNPKAVKIPEITDEYLYTHSDIILMGYGSEIIFDEGSIDAGQAFSKEDKDKIMVTYSGNETHHVSSHPGDVLNICGKEYQISGFYNNYGYDFIVPMDELISISGKIGASIRIKFWYEDTMPYSRVLKINEKMEKIKKSYYSEYDKPDIPMEWEIVFSTGKIIFWSMIISVLNFVFVYQFLLKNRLQQYRTLKLMGVTTNKIQLIIFGEMFLLYTISFFIAVIMLRMYIWYRELLVYSLGNVCMISYSIMLVTITIIFFLFTRKFSKSTPFASYQEI